MIYALCLCSMTLSGLAGFVPQVVSSRGGVAVGGREKPRMTNRPVRNTFHRGIMTRTTKTLLTLSLLSLLVGLTGVSGAIGFPFGAIFLGLSLISRVMQK